MRYDKRAKGGLSQEERRARQPKRTGYAGREYDPQQRQPSKPGEPPKVGGYRASRWAGRIRMLNQDVVDRVIGLTDNADRARARQRFDELRTAEVILTPQLTAQDGDKRPVDFAGIVPPRQRRGQRENAAALGVERGHGAGLRENQTAGRKCFLQSLCQVNAGDDYAAQSLRYSSRLDPVNCESYWRKRATWYCVDFNRMHKDGCKCDECTNFLARGQFPKQNCYGVTCQRDGNACYRHHICSFCLCTDKDKWDPVPGMPGYFTVRGCSYTYDERFGVGCCMDRLNCSGAFQAHVFDEGLQAGRKFY